jgi:hypothetical protein
MEKNFFYLFLFFLLLITIAPINPITTKLTTTPPTTKPTGKSLLLEDTSKLLLLHFNIIGTNCGSRARAASLEG